MAASSCGILSSSSDIEGCRAVVSGVIMDQTIRLRSSHVGVSSCMRLIRYSLRNVSSACLNDLDDHISQY